MITWDVFTGGEIRNGVVKPYGRGTCLSTDEKPTNMQNGSILLEMDTGNPTFFDEENEVWRNPME